MVQLFLFGDPSITYSGFQLFIQNGRRRCHESSDLHRSKKETAISHQQYHTLSINVHISHQWIIPIGNLQKSRKIIRQNIQNIRISIKNPTNITIATIATGAYKLTIAGNLQNHQTFHPFPPDPAPRTRPFAKVILTFVMGALGNHGYVGPSDVSWFINPSSYSYLRTINHSFVGVICSNWTLYFWPHMEKFTDSIEAGNDESWRDSPGIPWLWWHPSSRRWVS